MKLSPRAFGLACGILWGAAILVATIWTIIQGGGNTLGLLGKFYVGYSVSWGGAIIGLIWGFIDGFIFGWIFAWLYNKLIKE